MSLPVQFFFAFCAITAYTPASTPDPQRIRGGFYSMGLCWTTSRPVPSL
ncbi:hypothetical protein [Pseudophaeobacter arcticus]